MLCDTDDMMWLRWFGWGRRGPRDPGFPPCFTSYHCRRHEKRPGKRRQGFNRSNNSRVHHSSISRRVLSSIVLRTRKLRPAGPVLSIFSRSSELSGHIIGAPMRPAIVASSAILSPKRTPFRVDRDVLYHQGRTKIDLRPWGKTNSMLHL